MTWLNPARYRLPLRPLWKSSPTTRCDRCQLEYVPSLGWSRCPGCEALAGRDLRHVIEQALMKMRKDASR